TARSITDAIFKTTEAVDAVYVCGGGVHNTHLMDRIRELMRPIKVATTQELGVDPDYIEAIAFAWLAKQCLKGLAGNLPEVTGASGEKVLGSIYQATVKQSP
ncbi:MAG: anhydro-N-acetylmuramic acid kinase, partial [Gammaproteobacteria bacterium]|nr:anhydro-N-acetylmuramic acid kinase [Gammaproteobacteria bacterium]